MVWLFCIVLVDSIGFGIILPLLPIFAIKFHLSAFELGLLTAVFSFFQLLISPILGALSDRFGRKKIIIPCLFFIGISYIILANADTFLIAFLARALAGVFTGNISVVLASVADLSNNQNRAKYMGYIGAGTGLGFVLGPAIAGFLAGNSVEEANLQLVFYIAAFFTILSALFAALFLKETFVINNKNTISIHFFIRIKRITSLILFNNRIMFLLYLSIFMWFCFTSINVFLTTWSVLEFNLSPHHIGIIGTSFGLIAAISQIISPHFITGEKAIFVGFTIATIAMVILLVFTASLSVLALVIILLSIGIGVLYPNLNSTISLYGSDQQRGYVLGLSQSASTIGQTLGPIIIGIIYSTISPFVSFLTIAIIFLASSIFTLIYSLGNREKIKKSSK